MRIASLTCVLLGLTISCGPAEQQRAKREPTGPVSCSPTTLAAGDTLGFRMATPHGGELMVSVPSGHMMMIIWDRPVAGSLVPGPTFRTMDHLVLETIRVTGKVHGDAPPELVFTDTGTYWFRVGVVRTGGHFDGECFVHYVG